MTSGQRNIFIVGMMGAGKSAVGRLLAARLERAFVDADHELQTRTGVSIPTIFEIEGESGFRQREEDVIDELSLRSDGLVLATGGGAILSPATRSRLRQRGYTIYLDANAHDLWMRTRRDRNRPLLACDDPRERLEQLLNEREPYYREVADLVIETGKPSVIRLVETLIERLPDDLRASAVPQAIGSEP